MNQQMNQSFRSERSHSSSCIAPGNAQKRIKRLQKQADLDKMPDQRAFGLKRNRMLLEEKLKKYRSGTLRAGRAINRPDLVGNESFPDEKPVL